MALNAFWGHKEVIIVNETGCQLAKEIVKELREANFKVQIAGTLDMGGGGKLLRLCGLRGCETGLHPGGRGGQRVLCYPVQGRGLCGRPSGSPHQAQLRCGQQPLCLQGSLRRCRL